MQSVQHKEKEILYKKNPEEIRTADEEEKSSEKEKEQLLKAA